MFGPNEEDTREMKEGDRHALDEIALRRYMRERGVLDWGEVDLTVKKFSRGQSNPTYLLHAKTSGKSYVLRAKPKGKLIRGAHAIDREFRILSALKRADFAVPRVHLYCDDVDVVGAEFYVMDFVKGKIHTNNMSNANPRQRKPMMTAMVQALAGLHSLDPADLGLLGSKVSRPFGKSRGFYSRQIRTMKRLNASQTKASGGVVKTMANFDKLIAKLSAHMPEDVSCVIHGDFKPDNIIMSLRDDSTILAILDWELSTIGHPMSDLANFCLPYHIPIELAQIYPSFAGKDLVKSGIPSEDELHRAYCATARVRYPILNWNWYVAFACLRLSIIMQGVASRVHRGQASSHLAKLELVVFASEAMCDLGLNVIQCSQGGPRGDHPPSRL